MESRANRRRQRFPKTSRIYRAPDFVRLTRQGKRREGALVRLYTIRSALGDRLAVVTRRTIGKAHVRNLWRRRVRELFRREFFGRTATAYDYLVVIKRAGEAASLAEIRDELRSLLGEAK